ncbi:hypothetical protein FISHEDRAFT_33355 [Fistulina hepatica ATCC 64428]|uniref:Vacuolar protein sorting-associated protein 62 n=1 Tax=Fistulina hepatica ATCC 64428 TaxID=1128425 RepID=A0A0D7APG1_9AGAR|nr:hypothetical protein FISHEDRAFT_33355 [Fistulina hepatica ATCC 64428]
MLNLLLLTLWTSARPSMVRRDGIPDYVLTYAPHTQLCSTDPYAPSDIATHVAHVIPEIDYVPVNNDTVTIETLSSYSSDVYLTSKDNPASSPAWMLSDFNLPDSSGYSTAPATIILADKGNGVLDAFYFLFYSFNRGSTFVDIVFGDHVGDWEHVMVRFINETPAYIYLSEHTGGSAYTYDTLPTNNSRAITYVANGTHANYATVGVHPYEYGLVYDTTNQGPFWDVTQNYRGFWFDVQSETFTSAGGASIGGQEQYEEGASWLSWLGYWGDEQYPLSDPRQFCILGECTWESGPTGPYSKNLNRTAVCEDEDDCTILTSIDCDYDFCF